MADGVPISSTGVAFVAARVSMAVLHGPAVVLSAGVVLWLGAALLSASSRDRNAHP